MTDKPSPMRVDADEPGSGSELARLFRDWSELWREETRAQIADPQAFPAGILARVSNGGMTSELAAAMEVWRAAMVLWASISGAATGTTSNPDGVTEGTGLVGAPASRGGRAREPAATSRTPAAAVASDPRDAEIERLARRVDELEARLAKLENPRRRRG